MRIALVDDDPGALDDLFTAITAQIGSQHIIDRYPSGEAFLAAWKAGTYDLILLDIFIGQTTGIDLARKIRETDREVRIVFGTSSNEFASESYEVTACYYLQKPFRADGIRTMLDRLKLREMELFRTAQLPDGQSVILRNILYADITARHVVFHNKNGADTESKLPFSVIEPLLCAYPYFFSPSKGIVVNFYEVGARKDNVFILSDGSLIPISRRKAREITDAYASFCFENLRKGGDA